MKLTEEICFAHDIGLLIKCENWQELEKQILDDYEKARKFEKIEEWFEVTPKAILTIKTIFDVNQRYSEHIGELLKENNQNQKILEQVKEWFDKIPENDSHLYGNTRKEFKEIVQGNKK